MLQDPKYNHFHTHDDLSDFCTPTYVYSTFAFDSFIPVTKLKTLKFKSPVLV